MKHSKEHCESRLSLITRHFAYNSGAHAYSIGRLIADLEVEANHLVGADRLKVKALLESIQRDALALLIWSKKTQAGTLPR